MKKDFLKVKGLTKIYNLGSTDEIVALNDISFTVYEGEFVIIIGNNATGKTTLLNLIAGSLQPTLGDIILDGESILKQPEFKRARLISCVRQNPNDSVITSMTIAENLAMAKLRTENAGLSKGVKKDWKEEFAELLKPFGLRLEERLDYAIDSLSGGQKQIIALLMATIIKPKLFLLDEHTASLDVKVSRMVLEATELLVRKKKVTTLMVTHNINQAIKYGHRLILLDRGKIKLDVSGTQKQSLSIIDIESRLNSD